MLRFLSVLLVIILSSKNLSSQCSSFSWEPGESNGYDLFSDHPLLSEFGGNPMWTITLNGGSSFEIAGATIHLNPNQLAEIGSNGAEVCFTWGEANTECDSQTCLTLVYQEGLLSVMGEPTCEALFMISSMENGEVSFENMSIGSNETTIYNWNFGDESGNSDEVSPTHLFNYSGPRQVCLNMINYEGDEPVCSSTYCTTINVELQEITCESGTYPVTVSVATCCEAPNQNSAVFSFWNQEMQYNYFNAIGLAPFEAVASHSFCIPEGCYYVQFDYSLMEQAAEQIAEITVTSPNTTSFTIVELWEGLYWDLEMCFGETNPCNHEIIVSEGSCGEMLFELTNFPQFGNVNWTFGDETQSGGSGSATHFYVTPGIYEVCAEAWSGECQDGSLVCTEIVIESCESDCPTVIYGMELECGYYSFNIGNVQLGEAFWNFGDGETYDGTPWAQHNYTENGVYVVTATYYSQNCPDGVTLNYTVVVDCGSVVNCPSEIWSGAGEDCGVVNFEIGSFVQGESVTWFPGDDSGAVQGGHFFSHTYAEPGTYEVCAFYTTPNCPNGVELCKMITVANCESDCPTVIYGMELECGYYSFNIGNVQVGEAFWNFGDGETYDGTPWAQHNYTENGVYVVTATYYSQNCPDGRDTQLYSSRGLRICC
jgi:PKD repeat protein